MPKNKRPVRSYTAAAKELAKFVPSVAKYSKRKTLTSHEKAAITRATNKVRAVSNLIPVSKKQARELGRGALVGGGIRAIQMEGFGRDSKLRVSKGKAEIVSKDRRVHLERLSPPEMLARGQELIERGDVTVWLWTVKGRGRQGFRDAGNFSEVFLNAANRYLKISADELFIGLQWMKDGRGGDGDDESEYEYE